MLHVWHKNFNFQYDSPPMAGPSTFPGLLSDDTIDPVLQSTLKLHLDPASDPDLATPLKCMCYLAAGWENTSSGSILISKAFASHLQMSKLIAPPIVNHVPWELEHPDWSLLSLKTPSASLPRKMLEKRADNLTE